MEGQKDPMSDAGDGEDIPSDFFDDFNKEEFIKGLSVIDSWDDADRSRPRARVNAETFDSVRDLRELIRDDYHELKKSKADVKNKYKWVKPGLSSEKRSASNSCLDDFIKPGSRRDPNKTNEAIKKDKEVKVKEFLAKHLESSNDIRPPGTELDDYCPEDRPAKKKSPMVTEEEHPRQRTRSRERRLRDSSERVQRPHRSPRWSPRQSPRQSPRRNPRRSPRRSPPRRGNNWRFSPNRNFRRQSPSRRSPHRFGPSRRSPARGERRFRRSRSPYKWPYGSHRSRSRSPGRRDSFLYPTESDQMQNLPQNNLADVMPYNQPGPAQQYSAPVGEYAGNAPGYPFTPAYTGGFGGPYDYVAQPTPAIMPAPQLVPTSIPLPIINPVPAPAMVPAPPIVSPNFTQPAASHQMDAMNPYDALAQLVAEGKISKEDYLKLTPNKGVRSPMDINNRVLLLNRCNQALTKLSTLFLPSRLLMNNNIIGPDPKYIAPEFCSPLKRQPAVDFHFTKPSGSTTAQQNKQLVDSIIATLGLDKMITRQKRKTQKNMKDAAVQTIKPYCDVCEVRDSTKTADAETSIDPEHFCSTVHTQVLEHDLISSKSVFNPSGSIADGAPISISHLTPAQLVSQLAARAKTLKQTSEPAPPNQFGRRNPTYNYDGRGSGSGGGGQQYQNYNNYHY